MRPPGRSHYEFARYSHVPRWASYFHQLRECCLLEPESLLEVGVGDGVFGGYLRRNLPVSYRSVDLVLGLQPSVAGRIDALPFRDQAFDSVAAFQVLEHMPFETARVALAEMARVGRRFLVISVPSAYPTFRIGLKLPGFRELRILFKLPYSRRRIGNPDHFWELGARGVTLRDLRLMLEEYGKVERSFAAFENPYHEFLVVRLSNRRRSLASLPRP